MSKLKTNWAIRTTDEQFKAYILTLEALGYTILIRAGKDIDSKHPMSKSYCTSLVRSEGDEDVCRAQTEELEKEHIFTDISSFLVYHFSEEKTEAEKELEALQEKMNSLQEQIDRVKLSISK